MIQFQAKYLPPLMHFKASNDIRGYLNGIHVEPHKDGGIILVATNGASMLLVRDITGFCAESMTFHVQNGLSRFCAKNKSTVNVNQITERLTITEGGNELFIQPGKCSVNGKYPDFYRVLPDFTKLVRGGSSAARSLLMSEAFRAHPDFNSKYANCPGCINIWQEKETANSALIIEYLGYPEMVGIVMPMRTFEKDGEKFIEQQSKNFPKSTPIV